MGEKVVMCHPDNLELVKNLPQVVTIKDEIDSKGFWSWDSLEFRTDPYMEKDRPSGRYILPGGARVVLENVVVEEKFERYGPEDIAYLLWAGVVERELEPLFYIINPIRFHSLDFKPFTFNLRSCIKFGSV